MVQLYKRKGGEVLVNTQTLNNQSGANLALLPGGGFIIVWADGSLTGADTSGAAIRGQRFDANGDPAGGEFLVNSTVSGNQVAATVAAFASGRFVVTWTDFSATGGDASGTAVRGQLFEADGTAVGGEFLINTNTAANQGSPAIAELSDGGFVVSWTDNSGVGGDTSGAAVKAQIFGPAGVPVGGEFLVNTTTQGSQGASGISGIGLPNGGFAIVYSTTGSTPGGLPQSTVWVQRFDAAGAKVGGEVVVNDYMPGNLSGLNITALNSGFIVTWTQQDAPSQVGVPITYDIHAQLFDADGLESGPEFIVNTTTAGAQMNTDVDRLPGGGFLVTWQGPAEGADDFDIFGQFFDDDGNRIGGEFLINTVTVGNQSGVEIEVLPSGDIVIIWTDASATGADSSGSGVKMQILTLSSDAPTDIAISASTTSETAVENLAVATLSATNESGVNSHFTYEILSDSSGGAFRIDGDKLVVDDNALLDFETRPNVDIRIRVTDLNGTSYEEVLTIAVGDVVTETRYAASDEFVVTDDDSGFNVPLATVALAGGGFALITSWFEIGGDDSVTVMTYDAAGNLVGGSVDFEASGLSAGLVAGALPGGGFVTAYRGTFDFGNGDSDAIHLQMFNSSGQPVGGELLAGQTDNVGLTNPGIAVLDNGHFVVTWTLPRHEDGSDGGPFPSQIMARMFDQTGAPLGDEFRVNTGIEGEQVFSHVAALADGGFVVTWRDFNGDTVEAQRFDDGGNKVGGELTIVPTGSSLRASDLAALGNGGFVVTWNDVIGEIEGVEIYAIRAQIVDAEGVNVGGPITVMPIGTDGGHFVAAIPGGGFVVSWGELVAGPIDDPNYSNWARMYDSGGRPIGDAFQVSPQAVGDQRAAQVATTADGDLVFSWASAFRDENSYPATNMLARIFTLEGLASTSPTPGPDTLTGTAGGDTIDGLDGDDHITGLGGGDILYGGGGDDRLFGDAADDFLVGGTGADLMSGGSGNDTFYVDDAGDAVVEESGGGNDRVAASASFALAAGAEVELIEAIDLAGTGALDFTGSDFANRMLGNDGVNILRGAGGDDVLFGFGGADHLVGDGGRDVMYGGAGDDTYYVDDGGDVVNEAAGEGNDRIATAISYVLADNSEVELLGAITLSSTLALDLTGSNAGNRIEGNDGVNLLRGEGGNDLLYGHAGNDFLSGGAGVDFMAGGTGDDTFYVDDAADAIGEGVGEGNDRIATSVSYVLSNDAEVERLEAVTLSSTAAFDLTGSDSANSISGNNGVNILRGQGGDDILHGHGGDDYLAGGAGLDAMLGGAGNDTYYVDDQSDLVAESAGEGSDRVAASVSFALHADAEVELLEAVNQAATGALDLTGSTSANTIAGNAGANTIDGKGGNDTLIGLGGADLFAFTTALGANNIDFFVDFASGTDKIVLDHNIFTGLALGALNPNAFSNSGSNDGDDRIIFNPDLGFIYFDADGAGPGGGIAFALLQPGAIVTVSDFIVI